MQHPIPPVQPPSVSPVQSMDRAAIRRDRERDESEQDPRRRTGEEDAPQDEGAEDRAELSEAAEATEPAPAGRPDAGSSLRHIDVRA